MGANRTAGRSTRLALTAFWLLAVAAGATGAAGPASAASDELPYDHERDQVATHRLIPALDGPSFSLAVAKWPAPDGGLRVASGNYLMWSIVNLVLSDQEARYVRLNRYFHECVRRGDGITDLVVCRLDLRVDFIENNGRVVVLRFDETAESGRWFEPDYSSYTELVRSGLKAQIDRAVAVFRQQLVMGHVLRE